MEYVKIARPYYARLLEAANEVLDRLETLDDADEATANDKCSTKELRKALENINGIDL